MHACRCMYVSVHCVCAPVCMDGWYVCVHACRCMYAITHGWVFAYIYIQAKMYTSIFSKLHLIHCNDMSPRSPPPKPPQKKKKKTRGEPKNPQHTLILGCPFLQLLVLTVNKLPKEIQPKQKWSEYNSKLPGIENIIYKQTQDKPHQPWCCHISHPVRI